MITISTRDYTTEQLKDLATGLGFASDRILYSSECEKHCKEHAGCTTDCKAYAICKDIFNAWCYLYDTIKERETLELHRDTQ